MTAKTSLAALLLLAVAACGGPHNTDPRKGRVTLDSDDCLTGDCFNLYEFCLGPDLHIVYDEAGDDDYSRTNKDSEECK